jgi:hypothetical protein
VILYPEAPSPERSSYFSHSTRSRYRGADRGCYCPLPPGFVMLRPPVLLGGNAGTALRRMGRSSRTWPLVRRGMAGDTHFPLEDSPGGNVCPGGPPLSTISSTSSSSVTVTSPPAT